MGRVFALDGLVPVVDPSSFVHPTAVLIGDVIVGRDCYIGPGASLRGDIGRITVGDGANVQDNCVLHCFPGRECVLEADGHVGHGAVLHGCLIGRNALIGMNAVVMDGAVIGAESFVGALSFVKAGFEVPARHMAAGAPARILRELSDDEIAWKSRGTAEYRDIARRCRAGLVETEARREVEPDRPRLGADGFVPLYETRRRG
jgi:phenylacetic acid degradation protein